MKLFLSLFKPSPNIAILLVQSDDCFALDTLENIAVENEGKVKKVIVTNEQSRDKFYVNSREYEYIILFNIFSACEIDKKFLTKVYHGLENSAQIIVIQEKEKTQIDIIQALEDVHFLVVNKIDLFDDFDLIVGKKMHMWDNGL